MIKKENVPIKDKTLKMNILTYEPKCDDMDPMLQDILNDLEYDKVLVTSLESGEKYLNEFDEWQFSEVCLPNLTKKTVITFYSHFHWNEQIHESLQDIRKRCIDKYGYDGV